MYAFKLCYFNVCIYLLDFFHFKSEKIYRFFITYFIEMVCILMHHKFGHDKSTF